MTLPLLALAELNSSASLNSSIEQAWNPVFVEYAESQGRTPDDQLAFDRCECPTARMLPFVLWVSAKRRGVEFVYPNQAPVVAAREFAKALKARCTQKPEARV